MIGGLALMKETGQRNIERSASSSDSGDAKSRSHEMYDSADEL